MYSISNFRKHVYNRDERGWNYRTATNRQGDRDRRGAARRAARHYLPCVE